MFLNYSPYHSDKVLQNYWYNGRNPQAKLPKALLCRTRRIFDECTVMIFSYHLMCFDASNIFRFLTSRCANTNVCMYLLFLIHFVVRTVL